MPFLKDHAKSHNQLYPAIIRPASCLSPFEGAQRYEVFHFVKSFPLTPPLSSPPSEGRQSYELSGICKPPYSQRPIPRLGGSAKVRSFSLCQVPSIFHPTSQQGAQRYEVFRSVKSFPLTPPLSSPPSEGRQSYELFGICKPPYSQRPIPRLGGSAKVRSFSLCQAPLLFRPAFS